MVLQYGGVETVAVERYKFKALIAGMLLGDAGVFCDRGKNAYLRMQHGMKQKGYLLHKAEILKQLTSVNVNVLNPSGKKNPYHQIACATKRHPLYTRVREITYPDGKKTVTPTWLSWLDEHGLALWYMDDGSLCKTRNKNKSGRLRVASRRIHLNTCGFTLEENELLRNFIQERFGIKFYINKAGDYQGRTYHRLVAGAKEANKLFEIIRPYIVPCMEYKLDMEYDSQPKADSRM